MANLAVNGGPAVRTSPYPAWPATVGDEAGQLLRVLQSDNWSGQSWELDALAADFCKYTGAKYAVPVSNGTVGLEIILRAMGIGRGDEVIVPIYTFVASVSAIAIVGATPVFADVDYNTHLVSPVSVEQRITPQTKAIIAVHIGGCPCDMDAMLDIGRRHGLPVIEDSAQAHGAAWNGRKTGTLGAAGSFSFQESKNIPCGEGGMITTNNEGLYRQIWSVAGYGRSVDSSVWYDHETLGTNAGLAPWQAAVLRERLKAAPALSEKRTKNAKKLAALLRPFPFLEPAVQDARVTENAYHLFMLKYKKEALGGLSREDFLHLMHAEGITCISGGYIQPITEMELLHTQAFRKTTGAARVYDNAGLANGIRLCKEEGMWITQTALLEDEAELMLIAEALSKIQNNLGEAKEAVKGRGKA